MAPPPLPPELLGLIINCLQPPPLRLGDTKPADSYKPNQTALRNLCLASRQLSYFAQPVLYHTIVLHDHRYAAPVMDGLVRTLAKRTELAMFVQDLAVTTSPDAFDDMNRRKASHTYPRFRFRRFEGASTDPSFFKAFGLDGLTFEGHYLFERVLGSLLCLTKNCTRLLLEFPLVADLQVLQKVLQQYIVARALARSHVTLPLPNLKTLRVQGRPTTNDDDPQLVYINMQACPTLLDLPSICTFEIYQADGVSLEIDDMQDWPAKLHTMRLWTGRYMHWLQGILKIANGLKILELKVDLYKGYIFEDEEHLNQAIATRVNTLEDLCVSTGGTAGYINILGDELRVDCLAAMHKLRKLHIDTALLFYKKSRLAELDLYRILPPNLRELRLEESWYISEEDSDDMAPEDYAKLLLVQFGNLAFLRHDKLPKLEMIHFWSWEWFVGYHSSWKHWKPQLAMNFMRMCSELLGAANVRFVGRPPPRDMFPEMLEKHSLNQDYVGPGGYEA
ncbi:hypothetical protein N0V82_005997 [Gnomoniopsis sp. IMI 355080]|nr:hypothetical protein N0V82_005997 [Gnomoniopsis sp. IMI 355080]